MALRPFQRAIPEKEVFSKLELMHQTVSFKRQMSEHTQPFSLPLTTERSPVNNKVGREISLTTMKLLLHKPSHQRQTNTSPIFHKNQLKGTNTILHMVIIQFTNSCLLMSHNGNSSLDLKTSRRLVNACIALSHPPRALLNNGIWIQRQKDAVLIRLKFNINLLRAPRM